MRGMKTVGLLLTLAAALSFSFPNPAKSQGASDAQYYAAGNQYYAARNYAQATKYYYAAVKMNPNNASAYQGLGNCYYAMGRKADALSFYQRASALQPGNTQLAQFVQNLRAQVSGGTGAPAASTGGSSYLSTGYTLFQRRQYSQAIQYFNGAIQQSPNDYRPYYYAGYSYYMMGNAKNAALYFAIANAKQPNASIKAYADRVKASLSPDDQQWVDDQVAKYTGTAVAGGTSAGGKGSQVAFGFHLLGGIEDIFADPTDIKTSVVKAGSVSLSGVTPNIVALPELEPFVQLGDNFEINLAIGYFPVGNLSYTTYEFNPTYPTPPGNTPDVWKYTFNTTIITTDLGLKLLFGDKQVKGYLGISGGISPISMTFGKQEYDPSGTNPLGQDSSSGTYGALAFNAQAILGVDFSLGKGIAVGPYIGYRYLDATNFQNAGSTLMIDTNTGAVGTVGSKTTAGFSNLPAGDPVKALDLDFSGIEGGVDLTFSF